MGCDIHMVLERKVEGVGWVGIHNFPYYRMHKGASCFPPALVRNYERFAALAGVRGDGPAPRGIPEDVSTLSRDEIDRWGPDGHSHSWLPIDAAAQIFLCTAGESDEFANKYPSNHFFDVDSEQGAHRIVFWFDN
jgi:hypothetical protein